MSRLGPALAVALAGVAVSCAEQTQLADCDDSLSGMWRSDSRAPSGQPWQFHIVDRGQTIEVYPIFDDSRPPPGMVADPHTWYSPRVFDLRRLGRTIVGQRSGRATRDGTQCNLTQQAAIRSCRGAELTLAWIDTSQINWTTCTALSAPRWTRVMMRRL
ncbi:MAG: hypothetical protein AAGC55_09460 [Myxococcota bacterium]